MALTGIILNLLIFEKHPQRSAKNLQEPFIDSKSFHKSLTILENFIFFICFKGDLSPMTHKIQRSSAWPSFDNTCSVASSHMTKICQTSWLSTYNMQNDKSSPVFPGTKFFFFINNWNVPTKNNLNKAFYLSLKSNGCGGDKVDVLFIMFSRVFH